MPKTSSGAAARPPVAAYAAMLRQLFARQRPTARLGLQTMRRLCAALGHPERACPAVLVAGTNGKGSVASLLDAAARRAGLRCGLYTSPHLLRFGERIRIAGRPLTPAASLLAYGKVCRAAAQRGLDPSFFEAATAMAFVAFAAARLDLVILEVGLGGRLDATNVAPRRLCVISSIDYDHRATLGNRLGEIAGEKAAIMRRDCPTVSARQRPAVAAVLRQRSRRLGCPLEFVAATAPRPRGLPAVLPAYLRRNACLAARAARHLGIDGASFAAACAAWSWPGRYQWLAPRGGYPATLLDGAHNPAGAAALVAALRREPRLATRPAILLVGAVADKDVAAMVRAWRTLGRPIWAAGLQTPRSLGEAAWNKHGVRYFSDVRRAARAARGALPRHGALIACGSLYLVAEVLALLTGRRRDPPVSG